MVLFLAFNVLIASSKNDTYLHTGERVVDASAR